MPPTTALDAIELVLLLLAAAVGIRYLARRVAIAEPILLLVAGVLLGLFPNLPHVELEPDLVFALFLPPILFAAAYFTPIRDFRADARAILLLAVGLVLAAAVENLGYRQWYALIRVRATWAQLRGRELRWGEMARAGFSPASAPSKS